MNRFSLPLLSCFCALQLFLAGAQASTETENKNERVSSGDRTVELAQYQEAQVKKLASQSQIQSAPIAKLDSATLQARSLHFTTHPAAFQSIATISFFNDSIEIQDGSIWSVPFADRYIVSHWFPGDVIVVTPNHNLFSPYRFRMTNQNTYEGIDVDLNLGPFYMGAYTYQISALNDYTHQIILNDGSLWNISALDASIMAHWHGGDVVIIGVNDGLFSASLPNILINVHTLEYVEAVNN